jgi:hypothetical protein
MPDTPINVFISYSINDETFANRLRADLQARGINVWIATVGLTPGTEDWEDKLWQAIRASQALLLIASPQTRHSRHVKDELRIAEYYKLLVIPVWAEGGEWIECVPLGWGGHQYADARGTRYETALHEVVATLSSALPPPISDGQRAAHAPDPVPPQFTPRNPYKGLRAFTTADSSDFFGRDTLIGDLLDALDASRAPGQDGSGDGRLLSVVGPSGSGKSSVVMAGLLPRLKAGALPGSEHWVYLDPMTPGIRPVEALASVLSRSLPGKGLAIRKELDDDDAQGLHLVADSISRQSGAQVVLPLDQFEELFTLTTDEHERQRFIDLLISAVTAPHGPVIAILTLRADFYDRPMQYPDLCRLIQPYQKPVLPMDVEDLRAVIEKPAALPDVRLSFEGPLVGDLLYEVQGQAGGLPLLEFTLDELFRRRSGQVLTLEAYRDIGGVRGALAKHAETTYAELPSDEHRQMARILFLRLIDPAPPNRTPRDGGRPSRSSRCPIHARRGFCRRSPTPSLRRASWWEVRAPEYRRLR